jgi:AraC-like DNA-binding protein
VLPDGRIDWIVAYAPASGRLRSELFGAKTRALLVASDESVETLHVRIAPGGFRALFGERAESLTDRALDADELLGARGVELAEALARAPSLEARARLVERELLARAACAEGSALARAASRQIELRGGRISIAALARALGVGERRLERAFLAECGLAPKVFARIARLQRAVAGLRRASPAQVAADAGYADQAHLTREVVALAGAPPGVVVSEMFKLDATRDA